MAGFMGPKARAKDIKGILARLWRYLGRQRGLLLLVFLLVAGSSSVGLVGPYLIGRAIDAMAGGAGRVDFGVLARYCGLMLALHIASSVAAWLQSVATVNISQRTVMFLRRDLFAKLMKLPLQYFDKRTHGELMSRLANDVENVSNVLTQATTQVFSTVITLVGSLAAMLALSPLLTLFALVTVPIGICLTAAISEKTRDHFLAQQQELGQLNGFIEETVTGQRVVKAFCREAQVVEEFRAVNDRLRASAMRAQVLSGIIPPLMNVVNNLSFAIVAACGGWLTLRGAITLGVVASFLNYSRQFARPINDIANLYNMLQAAFAGCERVFEVMDEKEEASDPVEALSLSALRGDVRFENVTFGYTEGVDVLKNVDIHAKPGQTIALVGPTGAGKTTVVNLLTRFYDVNPDRGAILVDGRPITEYKRDDLRRCLGIVLQDAHLFAGTVRENIRYGRLDATDEEVERACVMANADVFIRRLPDGYDQVLTSEGNNLSQGQRQLLTIARAILANPSILILDEATSSVDTRTEMHIQEAMLSLMKGRTSFVIAHRLSTIRGADEIIVIDGGRIVERGTHDSLMAAGGTYHDLYSSQFRRQAELGAAPASA